MAEEEKVTEQVLEVSGNGTCVLKDTMGEDQLEKMDEDVKEKEETKDVNINGESELSKEKETQSGGKDEEKSEVEVMVEEGNDTKEEEQCDKVEEKDGESREESDKVEESKEQLVKIDDSKENIEKPENEEKNTEKSENEEIIEKPEDDKKKTEMSEADKDKTEDVREESEKTVDDKEKIKKPEEDGEESENSEGDNEKIEITEDKKGKIKKVKERKSRIEKAEAEEGSEKLDKPEDGMDKIKKVGDGNEEKESKKRRRVETNEEIKKGKKTEMRDKKAQEPVTPAAPIGRPVRERKSVERLVASIEREPAKELHIGKGRGIALKDIPNVAYKLSRKRTDETFIVLHTILFGRRGKAFNVKSNLSKFSGFVWHENEDKQKLKIKEKFDKFVKEKLLEFCDVLDIHVAKATTRKEDIVAKLVNFLEAPCATTNVLLAEMEQTKKGKKRTKAIEKSLPKSGHTTAKRSKRRKVDETPSTTKNDPKTVESEDEDPKTVESEDEDGGENNDEISDGTEEMAESSDAEDKKGKQEETAKSLKKCSMKDSSSKTKTMKATTPKTATPVISPKKSVSKSLTKHSKNLDTTILSSRKTNEDAKTANASTPKNFTEKNKEKMGKKVAEEKPKRKEKSIPTEDEIRDAACDILKKVDFNTATFPDILKKLVKHFGVDLTSRKVAIKEMIQEELAKLAPEEEDDDDEDNEENPDSSSQEVEA